MAIDPLVLDFGRDKKFCVYIYRDPRPRKRRSPIYVGKGITKIRPDSHWRWGTHNSILSRILAKIRESGAEPIVEFVGFFDAEAEAFALEKSLILRFGRRNIGTGTLANLSDGGEGSGGQRVISDETRRKISEAAKRRPPASAETRAKYSAARRGKKRGPMSAEQRAVLSAKAKLRAPPSVEARAKMSASRRGKKQSPEWIEKRISKLRGRPLSAETLAKLSVARKGKERPNLRNPAFYTPERIAKSAAGLRARYAAGLRNGRTRRVQIDGIEYASGRHAAAALGVTPMAVIRRIRRGRGSYLE